MSEIRLVEPVIQRRERLIELGPVVVGVTDAGPSGVEPTPSDVPTIVLLHGFTGRRSSWESVICALAGSCRVVAVDLPGHGETTVEEDRALSMGEAATVLEGVVVALAIERFALVGYSLGGRLALHYVLAFPDRVQRLVLEGVRPGLPVESEREQRRRADEELAEFIEARGLEAFVERWQDVPLLASQRQLPSAVCARLRAERLSQRAAGLAASLRGMGVGAQDWLEPRLSSIGVPVLLVSGQSDRRFTDIARAMAALLPQAVSRVVEDAGHNVHLEKPAEYIAAIAEFVGVTGASAGTTS